MKLNLDPLEDEILFDDATVACATLEYYLILLYVKMRDMDEYTESQARTMTMILFDQVIDKGEKLLEGRKRRRKNNKRQNDNE